MSTTTVLAIVLPVLAVLAIVVLLGAARRRDVTDADRLGRLSRETRQRDRGPVTAEEEQGLTGREVERQAVLERRGAQLVPVPAAEPPAPLEPPDAETLGVTRRQFFNRTIVGFFGLGLAGFGASVLAFLWPQGASGFGAKITVGSVNDVKQRVRDGNGFLYVPEGRMWVTEYPADSVGKAQAVYSPSELAGIEAGLIALYQRCPHLGCRVPSCESSQWFECPCHGSRYNQVGEKRGGPAPRGMDRFVMAIEGGSFTADTGEIVEGPPIGTNTTGQEPEGPTCLAGGGE